MHFTIRALILLSLSGTLIATGCSTLAMHSLPMPGSEAASESAKEKLTVARLSEKRGVTDRAKTLYHELLQETPDNPVPHHRLGVLAAKEGKFEEAMQRLAKAQSLAPGDIEIQCDIGYTLYLQNDLAGAEKLFRSVLSAEPYNKRATNNLAMVLGSRGNFEESFALFRRVGTIADAHANMGYLYALQGDFEKSLFHYDQCLDHDKEKKAAAEAIVTVNKMKRSRDSAIAMVQAAPDADGVQPSSMVAPDTQSDVSLVEFIQREKPPVQPINNEQPVGNRSYAEQPAVYSSQQPSTNRPNLGSPINQSQATNATSEPQFRR